MTHTETKPLRVQMRMKNNRILRAIEDLGFTSVSAACKTLKLSPSEVGKYVNFKISPLRTAGELYPACVYPGCEAKTSRYRVKCNTHADAKTGALAKTWTTAAVRIATALAQTPEYFWPESVREISNAGVVVVEVSEEQAAALSGAAAEFSRKELARGVSDGLGKLTPRERDIIERRFGFKGEEQTLGQIARDYRLSSGRVQQLESRALRKLRHSQVSSKLEDFA